MRPHAATGIGQFPRNSFGNEFRETLQRAYISGHADVDLLNTEPSVCTRIATVSSRDHIDRATNATTLNCYQHRHPSPFQRSQGILEMQDVVSQRGTLATHFSNRIVPASSGPTCENR